MYELWNLLPDTMTREEKEKVCEQVLKWGCETAQYAPCGHEGDYGEIPLPVLERFCAIPAKEPEKPKRDYIRTVEQSACAKCGICFVGGELLILRPDRFLEHPTCPPKLEVEGLDDILCDIQTDECNQHMHDDAKRRIVEAVKALILKHPDVDEFIQAVEEWGGIAK